MKVLVIGGTGFVGRHLVRALTARGHDVTLFNRGRSGPDLFPGLKSIIGDREVSHEALRGLRFDAAVDTNGRQPASVREAASVLHNQVGHYTFISSISAYAALQPGGDISRPGSINEDSALASLADHLYDDRTVMTYGGRKAVCEQIVNEVFDNSALIVRPGLVVGPEDSTDRFTYWPVRYNEGGTILAPGTGSDDVRFIDARDLAIWLTKLIESGTRGTFNAVGPATPMTMRDMLTACADAAQAPSETIWVSEDFLSDHGVKPWSDMPVWAPGLIPIDNRKPVAAGLTFRPVAETALDTISWARSVRLQRPLQAGLSAAREAELLALWKNQ
jgi:2'-hydroxyisoflavone reductase